jgi:hypothetical protein
MLLHLQSAFGILSSFCWRGFVGRPAVEHWRTVIAGLALQAAHDAAASAGGAFRYAGAERRVVH